jgi:hypothetical protein
MPRRNVTGRAGREQAARTVGLRPGEPDIPAAKLATGPCRPQILPPGPIMTTATAEVPSQAHPLLRRILITWPVVAVLDALYVTVVFGFIRATATPMRLWQGVARAILDKAAFEGGASTAFLGLAMHFCVALGWTVVWALVYGRAPAVQRLVARPLNAVLAGLAYGVFIWLAMNRVILPLVTYIKPAPLATLNSYLVLLSHLTVIGPPIVLLMRDKTRR